MKRCQVNRAMLLTVLGVLCMSSLGFVTSCGTKTLKTETALSGSEPDHSDITVIEAGLTSAPMVPSPITRKRPAKVIVRLEVLEVVKKLADGVDYTFWTFGGSVPGKFIRVRHNDEVEFHLMNHPDSRNPHNIDLHAVTGPGGGASATFVAPGQEAVFNFRALQPGLYVYHCATAPVGMHIANGMYGLILVEPEAGMELMDREYYVMQGDFYTKGNFGAPGLQPFDMEKALDEKPSYVVFNGSVGSMTGDNAITAKVGEKVRLFVGNGGPNLISSFHVIGEIFDKVYMEAGSTVNNNIQTTLIPAGGAAIIEFKVEVPGTYVLVDHSILRAFNKGALGMLKVEGPANLSIYSGQITQKIYLPEGATVQEMPKPTPPPIARAKNKEMRIKLGRTLYSQNCQACHQAEGQGIKSAFPPLAKADYLNEDVDRAIEAVAFGLEGQIKVNGEVYNSIMPKFKLTDEQIANLMTYVYNSWGNKGGEITPEQVKKAKAKNNQ